MEDLIYKITTQVREENEKFIFETIRPYCEEVTQTIIDKKTLLRALVKDKAEHIGIVEGHDICPSCHLDITNKVIGMKECYCVRCGQHILRSW